MSTTETDKVIGLALLQVAAGEQLVDPLSVKIKTNLAYRVLVQCGCVVKKHVSPGSAHDWSDFYVEKRVGI